MATEFIDSFAIYELQSGISTGASQTSLLTRWNGLGNNGSIAVQASQGSRGNPALWMPFGGLISKTHSHQSTYTVGFRLKIQASFGNVGGAAVHTLLNNGQALATLQVNVDGTVLLYAGNTTAHVVALTTGALLQNTFYYIEYQAVATGTSNINIAGEIRINGATSGDFNASGNANSGIANTDLTSQTATFNRAQFSSGVSTPGGSYFTDYYLNNPGGGTNTGFDGDQQITAPISPNADGGTIQWTPLTGTNFGEIDENPADGDTSYNSTAVVNNKDIFAWTDLAAFTGTILTVQLSYFTRKDDEGVRSFNGNIGTTGTEASTATFYLSDNYVYYHQAFDLDPATSLAWTRANFNAKNFGYKLVS